MREQSHRVGHSDLPCVRTHTNTHMRNRHQGEQRRTAQARAHVSHPTSPRTIKSRAPAFSPRLPVSCTAAVPRSNSADRPTSPPTGMSGPERRVFPICRTHRNRKHLHTCGWRHTHSPATYFTLQPKQSKRRCLTYRWYSRWPWLPHWQSGTNRTASTNSQSPGRPHSCRAAHAGSLRFGSPLCAPFLR